jgi:hypothetical protein
MPGRRAYYPVCVRGAGRLGASALVLVASRLHAQTLVLDDPLTSAGVRRRRCRGGPGDPEPRLGWTQVGSFTVTSAPDGAAGGAAGSLGAGGAWPDAGAAASGGSGATASDVRGGTSAGAPLRKKKQKVGLASGWWMQ